MSKQDNLTKHLDTKVLSVPLAAAPVPIANRTPSKANNDEVLTKTSHYVQSIKSSDSEENITPSFSSCFSSSPTQAITMANTHHLNRVQAKLKKYIKKMQRRLHVQ
eukprot:12533574-Ditylum_brightwellii.AAC.1